MLYTNTHKHTQYMVYLTFFCFCCFFHSDIQQSNDAISINAHAKSIVNCMSAINHTKWFRYVQAHTRANVRKKREEKQNRWIDFSAKNGTQQHQTGIWNKNSPLSTCWPVRPDYDRLRCDFASCSRRCCCRCMKMNAPTRI